jgi:death-on-curing protein
MAASIGIGVIAGHPFVDGNKRVGYAAMLHFLARNGISPGRFDPDQLFAAVMAVASGEMDREGLAKTLRKSLRR